MKRGVSVLLDLTAKPPMTNPLGWLTQMRLIESVNSDKKSGSEKSGKSIRLHIDPNMEGYCEQGVKSIEIATY